MDNKNRGFIKIGGELLAFGSIVGVLLAGCGGGGSSAVSTPASSAVAMSITPALGQVYSGQISVTGSNGTNRNYAVASGVASVTADISGMTAPLLIALTGDPANGNQLVFFDEGLHGIASSVVSAPASAVRAIVPDIANLPATGIAVTPLTEVAAAAVTNASGVVDISTLSVASALGANAEALALAQSLSNSTVILDVLAPPTTARMMNQTLGVTAGDVYAKILYTLANLPSGTYGANAYAKARTLGNIIASTGNLPSTFDADVVAANAAVTMAGYSGTIPVAISVIAPVGTAGAPISTNYFDFNYLQNVNGAASAVAASIVDNGSGTQTNNLTFGPTPTIASFNAVAGGYSWGLPLTYGMGFNSSFSDSNVPAAAMICQAAGGIGGVNGKSTDVLVTSASTPLVSAGALAGLTFSTYDEDCLSVSGHSASFDASGNATFNVTNGGVASTVSFTAAEFTSALTGTPTTKGGGYTTFSAYRYKTAFGLTRYVLVEHGSSVATGLTSGYVGIWRQ